MMARRMILRGLVGLVIYITGTGAAVAGGWAGALFPARSHDFGPVPPGAKLKHDFVVSNRLAEPVTILNLRASCGCTSGKASTSTLSPGQTALIEAQIDTRNFLGVKATILYATLVTASGREAEVRL